MLKINNLSCMLCTKNTALDLRPIFLKKSHVSTVKKPANAIIYVIDLKRYDVLSIHDSASNNGGLSLQCRDKVISTLWF